MPRDPKGEKRLAAVIGAAGHRKESFVSLPHPSRSGAYAASTDYPAQLRQAVFTVVALFGLQSDLCRPFLLFSYFAARN
jgi:hypothetical protein